MRQLPASLASLVRHGLAVRGCSSVMQLSLSMTRCQEAVSLCAPLIECTGPTAPAIISLAWFQHPHMMANSDAASLGLSLRGVHTAAAAAATSGHSATMAASALWPGGSGAAAAAAAARHMSFRQLAKAARQAPPARQAPTATRAPAAKQAEAQQQEAPPEQQRGASLQVTTAHCLECMARHTRILVRRQRLDHVPRATMLP